MAALSVAARPALATVEPRFDVVLKGGTILDGTGAPAYPGDLGIVGGRVAAIEDIAATQVARVVDVRGLHVCPGFIDSHSHSDGDIPASPTADSRVRQGITSELTGNCGSSAAPPRPRAVCEPVATPQGTQRPTMLGHSRWSCGPTAVLPEIGPPPPH